jgi:hypothetical protein
MTCQLLVSLQATEATLRVPYISARENERVHVYYKYCSLDSRCDALLLLLVDLGASLQVG